MKHILSILLAAWLCGIAYGQQNMYKWRVGLHAGPGLYHGDLSTGRFGDAFLPSTFQVKNLSYGISVERAMGEAWSFRMMGLRGAFGGNDRQSADRQQQLRALNFKTEYYGADALFIYQFDNKKLLGESAFISPYLGGGLGYHHSKAMGDLFLEDGRRYYYWDDNTIRDIDQNSPFSLNAQIIGQDGIFETDLGEVQAEGADYAKWSLNVPMVFGVKFRLGDRFNLNLEALAHYRLNDYADDVSGDYPTVYESPLQAYASNPSGINMQPRGNGKSNDFYGMFNVGLAYNFGYKKQGFTAPVFYLGMDDPKVQAIVSDTTATYYYHEGEEETGYMGEDTFYMYTEPVYVYLRDTVEVEVVDTIKNQTLIINGVELAPATTEGERVVVVRDTVLLRDTIYEGGIEPVDMGDVPVEPVPAEPVFELETLENMRVEEVNSEYIATQIGDLRDDLSEGETVLAEVQESNFELVALRNEINELKAKDHRSEEEMDVLYSKLDELSAEMRRYESYNNNVSVVADDRHSDPDNQEVRLATETMAGDLATVRAEILELSVNNNAALDREEYERIRKENDRRIAALEKEMRKLRKELRREKQDDYIRNPSRSEPRPESAADTPATEPAPPTVIRDTVTIVVDKDNPEAAARYQQRIADLEAKLQQTRTDNGIAISSKSAEIEALKAQLRVLEQRLSAAPLGTAAPSATGGAEYAALLAKVEAISQQLADNQRELQALKNQAPPPPSTTTIIKTEPAPRPAADPAREAVARIGVTNVFFNTGKSSINTQYINDLEEVAVLMNRYPSVTARVTGFADKSGNPDANLRLSQKRSEAVATFLQSRGISRNRIRVNYQGESQAASSNDPYSRRVEVVLGSY